MIVNIAHQIYAAACERLSPKLVAHFFMYAGGRFLMGLVSMIAAPVMMVLLSTRDYGLISLIHSFTSTAVAIMGIGLPQVLVCEYFHVADRQRGIVINTVLGAYALVCIPVVVCVIACPDVIGAALFFPPHSRPLVYAVLVVCVLSFVKDIVYQILQYHEQVPYVAALHVGIAISTALFNIFLVGLCGCDVGTIVWVQAFMVAFVCAVGARFYVAKGYYEQFDVRDVLSHVPSYARLGVPLMPTMLVGWILAFVNRWMLARYAGLAAAGIYAVADAGGQLVYALMFHALQGSYIPSIMAAYARHKGQESMRDVERSHHALMALVLAGSLVCITFGSLLGKPLLYLIVPARYGASIDCIVGVLVSYTFLVGAIFVSTLAQFYRQTRAFTISLALAVLINATFNRVLIPRWGLSGCLVAMVLSSATYCTILWIFNRRLLKNLAATLRL